MKWVEKGKEKGEEEERGKGGKENCKDHKNGKERIGRERKIVI